MAIELGSPTSGSERVNFAGVMPHPLDPPLLGRTRIYNSMTFPLNSLELVSKPPNFVGALPGGEAFIESIDPPLL